MAMCWCYDNNHDVWDRCAGTPSFMSENEPCDNPWQCQMQHMQRSRHSRIVGGRRAPKMIPWQVSLRFDCSFHSACPKNGRWHYCGGTILDSKTIMTAAHCEPRVGEFVLAGKKNNRRVAEEVEIVEVDVQDYKPLAGGDLFIIDDIAMIKLASPLNFSTFVQPICLPSADFNPDNATCYVSGWGARKFGGQKPPKMLQYVDTTVITQKECKDAHKRFGRGLIRSTMICTQSKDWKGACQGDSGGPLVCFENGQPVITGIVSFGIGCARPKWPGVYTRVSRYLNYINTFKAHFQGDEIPPHWK